MSESFLDQYSRVRQMASGDPTWDLSPNDTAALTAVMDHYDQLLRDLGAVIDQQNEIRERQRRKKKS